jgi:hypothetical protein
LRQADAIELNDLFRRLEKEEMYKIKYNFKHICDATVLGMKKLLTKK